MPIGDAPAAATAPFAGPPIAPAATPSGAMSASPRRRRLWIGAVVAAAVIVAAVLISLAVTHQSKRSTAAPSAAPNVTPSAAASAPSASVSAASPPAGVASAIGPARLWIDANIAHATPISAEPELTGTLHADGFTALPGLPGGQGGQDWHAAAYLVSTPTLRAHPTSAASAALQASAPVAVFGTGDARIEVRRIDPTGGSDLTSRSAADASQRQLAGQNLLRNSHLHADQAAAAALNAGNVDLRADTVLALLADKADIQISGTTQDPAEAAAGLPVRTVTVSSPNSTVLGMTLDSLPVTYRPLRMTAAAGGAAVLVWDVAIAPVESLS